MLNLRPEEKIIKIVHRHWIIVAGKLTLLVFMFFVPFLIFIFMGPELGGNKLFIAAAFYILSIYFILIMLIAFVRWIDYYLDIWIITDERIIDIEQNGMFYHEVSEFSLERIQDITSQTPNFLATVLKYGNIRIQTAGEKSFSAEDVPRVNELRSIILDQARSFKNRNK